MLNKWDISSENAFSRTGIIVAGGLFVLILTAVIFLTARESYGPDYLFQPLTVPPEHYLEYEKMIEYMPEEMRDNLRLPMMDEPELASVLWPTIAIEQNAAYYFARAISFFSDQKAPAGAASARDKYDGDIEALTTWVKDNEKALGELQKAITCDTYQFPPLIYNGIPYYDPQLKFYAGLRQLARLSVDVGFLAELQGDNETAAEHYLRCVKMGDLMTRNTVLIGSLVGGAVKAIGVSKLEALVANAELSEDTLDRIISYSRSAMLFPEIIVRIYEKNQVSISLYHLDEHRWRRMIQHNIDAYTSRQPLIKGLSIKKTGKESDNHWDIQREMLRMSHGKFLRYCYRVRKKNEVFQELARKPLSQLLAPNFDLADYMPKKVFKDKMVMWNISSKPRIFHQYGRLNVSLGALQLRAAIELYKKEASGLPQNLEQLCPKWLPEVPIDPFSGTPLKYKKEDGKWLVYSVGEDGIDDGGDTTGISRWQQPDYNFPSEVESNIERNVPRKDEAEKTERRSKLGRRGSRSRRQDSKPTPAPNTDK